MKNAKRGKAVSKGLILPAPKAIDLPGASKGVQFTETGLVLEEGRIFTKGEWNGIGEGLAKVKNASNWLLGDWMVKGPNAEVREVDMEQMEKARKNHRRIERGLCVEVAKALGVSPGHLSNCASVCKRVPLQFRQGLTIEHAKTILQEGLPDKEFPKWRERVLNEKLSVRELRREIRQALRTEKPSPPTSRPVLFFSKHMNFVREWARESETWTEAEWRGYAEWHKPVITSLKSRGLL